MVGIALALVISNLVTFWLTCRYTSKRIKARIEKKSASGLTASNLDSQMSRLEQPVEPESTTRDLGLARLDDPLAIEDNLRHQLASVTRDYERIKQENITLAVELKESDQNHERLSLEVVRLNERNAEDKSELMRLSTLLKTIPVDQNEIRDNEKPENRDGNKDGIKDINGSPVGASPKILIPPPSTEESRKTTTQALKGRELLERVRALSNRTEDQIARACGYIGPRGRVLKKSFYSALVEAKRNESIQISDDETTIHDISRLYLETDSNTVREWYEGRIDGLPGDDYICRCTRLIDWWVTLPGTEPKVSELFAKFIEQYKQEIDESRCSTAAQADIDELLLFIERECLVDTGCQQWYSLVKAAVGEAIEGLIDINMDISESSADEDLQLYFKSLLKNPGVSAKMDQLPS